MSRWREWGRAALVALAIFLVVVSILPLWWTDHWWVRLWDFPRLQVAALLFVTGAILCFVELSPWRWWLVGLVAAALAWQVSHFLSYLPYYPKQVRRTASCAPERQVSLITANVLMTNRDFPKLLRLVEQRQPDLLLLLETDEDWSKAVEPLNKIYPFQLSEPLPNTYGLILMSRLPMTGSVRHRMQRGIPSADTSLTLRDGSVIRLHALHPEPPLPGDNSGERDAELVMVGRQVRDEGVAAVVVGDLNDVAWSRTSRLFRQVAGMGDPRIGRGLYPTFNARYPLLHWPLDHLFVSPHFELIDLDRLPDIGSDHFPMAFRLCLKGSPSRRKVAPSASPATEAEATEELQAGKLEKREEQGAR